MKIATKSVPKKMFIVNEGTEINILASFEEFGEISKETA